MPGQRRRAVPHVVDLSGPAYRCSCPSRKIPCKHVLALLLLWSEGSVPDDAAGPPDWAGSWLVARAAKASRAPSGDQAEPKDPSAAARRAEQREARVASGLAELDRWLCDQVRQGLAASQQAGYAHWDDIAARMVDAQAPGLAERLRALASVPHSGAGWDGRLLEEYALLHLLAVAYRRQAELPPPLRDTVRSRIGFSLRQADVLAGGQPIRDHWQVLARRDLEQDRIRTRRTWLRGRKTGRDALLLSFAAAGQALDDSLPSAPTPTRTWCSTRRVPLRAAVLARHDARRGAADGAAGWRHDRRAAGGYAAALAADPWLDSWLAVVEIIPVRAPALAVRGADGGSLPLHPGAGDCWPLFALSGGRPVTLAGEWTPRGLWPLTPGTRPDRRYRCERMAGPGHCEPDRYRTGRGSRARRPWPAVPGRRPPGRSRRPAARPGRAADGRAPGRNPDPSGRIRVPGRAAPRRRTGPGSRGQPGRWPPARPDARRRAPGSAGRVADRDGSPRPPGPASPAARAARPGPAGLAVRPGLRRLSAEAGGARARWLARLNPDWTFVTALTESGDDTWRLGGKSQRRGYLAALRARDPAAARELITQSWAAAGPERVMFLSVLANQGLSLADEPLLESALDERDTEVRGWAAHLLARLPGSALGRGWRAAPPAACASTGTCAAPG
jgi:hypothetical protein